MIRKLKRRYNRWLFKKYGFQTGLFYEKIPVLWRWIPLFSPSLYTYSEGRQISEWISDGIQQGLETTHKNINDAIASKIKDCGITYDAVIKYNSTDTPKEAE